jgi:predicted nucleotidyltransferase
MIFHRVLDQVFSTWSHIAVLRVLQDIARGLTGREIARLSSMSHRACLKALTDLEDLHLIVRQRGGRDHLFVPNWSHVLNSEAILPLLQVEREFPGRLEEYVKARLRRRAVSVILYGSVARHQETAGSDLDLCILVRTISEKKPVQERIHSFAPELQEQFGARVSPVIYTIAEFVRGLNSKKAPMYSIAMEGKVISGKSMHEVTRG